MSTKPGTRETTASSASLEHEAQVITQLLENRLRGDQRAWVIFNAALLIYAAGLASSLAQATPLAHDMLDSGKVGVFFQNLVNTTARTSQSPDSLSSPMVTA